MKSINEQRVRQRNSYVWDTFYGAQTSQEDVKKYTKELSKIVNIEKEVMGNANDFRRDFGSGI